MRHQLDGWVDGALAASVHELTGVVSEGADIIALDLAGPLPGVPHDSPTMADLDETIRLVEAQDRRIIAKQGDVRDIEGMRNFVDESNQPRIALRASETLPRDLPRLTGHTCERPATASLMGVEPPTIST